MSSAKSLPSLVVVALAVVVGLGPSALVAAPITSTQKDADGVTFKMDGAVMKLQVFSDRVIRVVYAPGTSLPNVKSLSVIAAPAPATWDYQESPDALILKTSALQARVDPKTGAVSFADVSGKPYLAEVSGGGKSFSPSTIPDFQGLASRQDFTLAPEEAIFGLGQHRELQEPVENTWNYRGQTVQLMQANMEIGLPILISSRGYGILWDNPAITSVAVGIPGNENVVSWNSQAAHDIDYYFMAGPEIDDVVGDYRMLTGAPPLFGEWAYGFWQCREHYASQQEILDVVARYRQRGTPIDGIIQDWRYWDPQGWGSHYLDPARYPDPAGMMKQLHDQHIHLIISVRGRFDDNTDHYKQREASPGLLSPRSVIGRGGLTGFAGPGGATTIPEYAGRTYRYYDPFNPDAAKLYWKQMSDSLFKYGIDGWWLDATEPELGSTAEPRIRNAHSMNSLMTGAGPGAYVANAYPLQTTTNVYQGQRAETSQKRVFILTRSAYAGQQRNGAVSWSGDIQGTWATFARQIRAGLNFSICGIPYWNTDIGGFNSYQSPGYTELFTRWFQFGSFCPMFRVHGQAIADNIRPSPNSTITGQPDRYKEMWLWDPKTDAILVKFDQLRYRLMPYIYSTAWQITSHADTLMRPLVMDFRSDPQAVKIGDQYMWGRAILVNPVTSPGATSRAVYLPAGQDWYDFWTGRKLSGGQTVDAPAPIDSMPLYVKAGSIVPMGPIVNYAREKVEAPIELRIYRGNDGAMTLYEDAGDGYNYENGEHAEIPITWTEATGKLSFGRRVGQYPGMPQAHVFHVVFVRDAKGAGLSDEQSPDLTVSYNGDSTDVQAP
ncbi:MAG: glycoside hydrolase family 31 protein [Tepidisphaeraceae bacterium]